MPDMNIQLTPATGISGAAINPLVKGTISGARERITATKRARYAPIAAVPSCITVASSGLSAPLLTTGVGVKLIGAMKSGAVSQGVTGGMNIM